MAIEFNAKCGGYNVTTRSDGHYFTVYYKAAGCHHIAGTIARPQRGDRRWSAWSTEGTFLGNAIGPRTALLEFIKRDRRNAS